MYLINKLLITLTLLILISLGSFAQVISHNNGKGSERPKDKGNTIVIKDYILPMTEYGMLVIMYKTGSQTRVDSIKMNDKKLSIGQLNHITKITHTQGIILIGLGANKKAIRGNITIYLKDNTGVRGAIASTYENVDLNEPNAQFVSMSTDSTSSLIKFIAPKGSMVIDCIGSKIKEMDHYKMVASPEQKVIVAALIIKMQSANSKSAQVFSASEMLIEKEEAVTLEWQSNESMFNGMHMYFILRARE